MLTSKRAGIPLAWACVLTAAATACAFGIDVGSLTRCDGEGAACDATNDAATTSPDAPEPQDDSATLAPCPSGRGPAMIRVSGAPGNAGSFCIDRTEVTRGEYLAFVGDEGALDRSRLPTACRARATFVPKGDWPPEGGASNDPVTFVDQCDAQAFCAWAGKRLCGTTDSGPLAPGRLTDARVGAWAFACTAGERTYPYGAAYDGAACNGVDHGLGRAREVGAQPGCASADGVVDLSGNVWEWVDACEADRGDGDRCYALGGAFNAPAGELVCASARGGARTDADGTLGFRCCAP